MDALVAALVFLQAEVGHGGRQLGHLAVQEARQLQLLHFFLCLDETAQKGEKQCVKPDARWGNSAWSARRGGETLGRLLRAGGLTPSSAPWGRTRTTAGRTTGG